MVTEIWIEAEEWVDGWDIQDCNSDVIVTFDFSQKWVATFFTYENIHTLTKKNQLSGENLNGLYFGGSDMILVQKLDRPTIEEVVCHLLETNEFEDFFKFNE